MGVGHVPQEPLRPEGAHSEFQRRECRGASTRGIGRSRSAVELGKSKPDSRQALGSFGEDLVVQWYEMRGYEIVDRNWRCRSGEIDVIAQRGHTVVICEVKTRSSRHFGEPSLAVDRRKQQRLRRLAATWLSENTFRGSVRFDVAEVIIESDGAQPSVQVIEAAF